MAAEGDGRTSGTEPGYELAGPALEPRFAFQFSQAAPDPVRLPRRQRVVEAFRSNDAVGADGFRFLFASVPLGRTLVVVHAEEEDRGVGQARGVLAPLGIGDHRFSHFAMVPRRGAGVNG